MKQEIQLKVQGQKFGELHKVKKMSETPESKFNTGSIQVAVWDNESKEGNAFQSISIQKRYKVGEEWKTTNSLNINEIPKAILALQKAYEHLVLKE